MAWLDRTRPEWYILHRKATHVAFAHEPTLLFEFLPRLKAYLEKRYQRIEEDTDFGCYRRRDTE